MIERTLSGNAVTCAGTTHVLDDNTAESSYFGKLSKNGKASYRRAVYTLTGDLPIWAKPLRRVYTQANPKVYTQEEEVYTQQVVTLVDVPIVTTLHGDRTVTTLPIVTTLDALEELPTLTCEEERLQPGWIDPLSLVDA
ncbi:hypothetical protein AX768_23805 [Burkholderia sp. PAMC 28687]|nr:hypothetical protein AX768_23805 [Burkholderia sp. PAMC 28687]